MNKILKLLITYDLLTISSFGLAQPIFAIFLKEEITGASVAAIGTASAIFLASKSIIQPFVGKIADHEKSNKREIIFLFFGAILIISTPLIYIVAENIYHIYLAQFVYGVGSAFSFASWYALYSKFIDKNKEGYEWSIYDSITGLASAFTAFIGGFITQFFGFTAIFLIIFVFTLFNLIVMFFLRKFVPYN